MKNINEPPGRFSLRLCIAMNSSYTNKCLQIIPASGYWWAHQRPQPALSQRTQYSLVTATLETILARFLNPLLISIGSLQRITTPRSCIDVAPIEQRGVDICRKLPPCDAIARRKSICHLMFNVQMGQVNSSQRYRPIIASHTTQIHHRDCILALVWKRTELCRKIFTITMTTEATRLRSPNYTSLIILSIIVRVVQISSSSATHTNA